MKEKSGFMTLRERTDGLKQTLGIFIFLAVLFAIPLTVAAQSTTATIVGSVTDPGGAQVPNASITARNADTGLKRTVVSGEDGSYRIEFLPVGKYVVEVTATSGFKKAFRDGIVLQVNDTGKVDISLEVGSVTESVTITGGAAEVNTSNAELGRTIQTKEIENLPLVERNIYALLDLTPGVQSNNSGVATASAATNNLTLGFPEQRTLINGGTDGGTGSVNYFLDGGTNMTNLRNTGNSTPSPDAIQEFRVQTNSYNAEYGRFASGIINVLTKSGTNQFHGSLYEFTRSQKFNANEWGSQVAKAPYKRNQFGGTIGGPIKRDKSFFFFSYSGLRQLTNRFLAGAVLPTALERAGNFTLSATKPKDPATGQNFFCNGVEHVICANRVDPVARKIVDTYLPASNITNANGTPGYQGNVPTPFDTNEYLIKLDHQLNEPHRLSFSYFTTAGVTTVFPGSGNLPWATQNYKWRQHNFNASDVWILSPDKINQVWVTYGRNLGGRLNVPSTSLRDLGSSFFPQGTPSLPQINVTGYFSLTNAIGGPRAGTNLYSMRDIFSWNAGRHSLKLGGELTLNKDIQETLLNNYGVFTFNASTAFNTTNLTTNAFGNFLLGIPSAVTQDSPVTAYTDTWYGALFVQDDFRVHPRLTVNLGLRWDVQTPPTDPENRVANYIAGKQSVVRPNAPPGILFFGDEGVERGGIPTNWTHFSPRFGIAWDPKGDGKTSIRAAVGGFYGSISGNEWNTQTNTQPFSTRLTFSNINPRTTTAGVPIGASLSNPYNAFVGGPPFPYTGAFLNGGSAFAVAQNFGWPHTLQMNVSLQRQLTKDLTAGAAYVGTLSGGLPFGRDINYPVLTPTATSAGANILSRRPNPLFGAVTLLQSDQHASYHAGQFTAAYRMAKRFTMNAYYTFSKTLSSVQLHNNTTQGLAQNYSRLNLEKGRADTDQRHVFSMSLNFQPDYYEGSNKVVKAILNGWSISPILKLRSGRPFTVTNANVDANLDGVTTDRAQLIGDPHIDNPTAARWFNTAAFARNLVVTGVATEGTSPRNLLTGPGFQVVDLGLSRDFRFGERFKVRFRAEGTNIFNNVNYDLPNASVPAAGTTSTTFGVISSAGDMRKLQFGARLTF
ncbi:MAG TPA: carboxypeptidase regulatory-like domain-containing protein [Pyrinomonadaceae bacterium]|nr:carboxypeptidase regulatory-like domain-containing protein [Pyrinomonadaceae bacterium]